MPIFAYVIISRSTWLAHGWQHHKKQETGQAAKTQ
jgi:hypothetical protein